MHQGTKVGPLQKFHDKHGHAFLVDGWWVFQDGAMRENHTMGAMHEPSIDPYELASTKLLYFETELQQATEQHTELYHALSNHAEASRQQGYAPPGDEKLEELEKLQQLVQRCQRCVQKARKHREAVRPDAVKRHERVTERNRYACERFLGRMSKLRI